MPWLARYEVAKLCLDFNPNRNSRTCKFSKKIEFNQKKSPENTFLYSLPGLWSCISTLTLNYIFFIRGHFVQGTKCTLLYFLSTLLCECSQLNWGLGTVLAIYILEYVWCNSFTYIIVIHSFIKECRRLAKDSWTRNPEPGTRNLEPGTRNLEIWPSFLPIFAKKHFFYPFQNFKNIFEKFFRTWKFD